MSQFFEIGATILGLIQGFLVMLNKRSNWIFYCFQMLFLILFSLTAHLYGDVTNNSIYFIIGIIGFILWGKNNKRKITACHTKERIIYILISALGTGIWYLVLKNTNDPLPLLDAFTTTTSFVATYYMVMKKIDTWIIWFINDIFYCIEYFILPDQALYLFALNIIWTFMAIYSYYTWHKLMNKEPKKIYFAGKFNLSKDKNLPLHERLVNDFRSIILKDAKLMVQASKNLKLNNHYIYNGPFYCEEASNGNFTSTDCNVVLNAEFEAVKNSDIYLVVFNSSFSVGSIVELEWALNLKKEIVIFYQEEASNYTIKSEYWFAIADALNKSKKVKVYHYKNDSDLCKLIEKNVLQQTN